MSEWRTDNRQISHSGEVVVDLWGGTDEQSNGSTLYPIFSSSKVLLSIVSDPNPISKGLNRIFYAVGSDFWKGRILFTKGLIRFPKGRIRFFQRVGSDFSEGRIRFVKGSYPIF